MRRRVEIDLTTNEMVYTLRGDGGELGGAALARLEDIDIAADLFARNGIQPFLFVAGRPVIDDPAA